MLIPPSPRRFGDVSRLGCKYDIRDTWLALFPGRPRRGDTWHPLTVIATPRETFASSFGGLWRLLYAGLDDSKLRKLLVEAPPQSASWYRISRLFELFPFEDHFLTLEFLSCDWGAQAQVELDYGAILYNFDKDLAQAQVEVEARHQAVRQVFAALAKLDPGSLYAEPILASDGSPGHPGLYLEVTGYSQHSGTIGG